MTEHGVFMIYGANGYTGKHCALEALERGMRPILAGRNKEAVEALAAELNLAQRIFNLSDTVASARALEDVTLVLNCAGPFSATAAPMLDACVISKTHYLDVTGEISVFETIFRERDRWTQAGIAVLPGVGYDVVPSDCLAAMLKEALPDATTLRLALKNKAGHLSPGTAKTILEGVAQGVTVRRDGAFEQLTVGTLSDTIPFASGEDFAIAIPWGDVSTAFHSTGIPNIEVFTAVSEKQYKTVRRWGAYASLLQKKWIQQLAKWAVGKMISGPDETKRLEDTSEFYGLVSNESGDRVSMTMTTPNGYSLTFESAIRCAEHVLAGKVGGGAWTPSLAFGSQFIKELSGVACGALEQKNSTP
ncbi:MAG: NAD(P)H-binding protein [Candidatus Hydrogenedentes bacterium]|nr:NAD(P)H-binding protein [Candidatus Hydrogenedentota bacterium]